MVARTQGQKIITQRGHFEARALTLRAQRGFSNERRVIGRDQTLEDVAHGLAVVNVKPAQFPSMIESVLDRLGELKATWRRSLCSTSVGDVLVSVLSGGAWIAANVGFHALVPPDLSQRALRGGGTGHERDA